MVCTCLFFRTPGGGQYTDGSKDIAMGVACDWHFRSRRDLESATVSDCTSLSFSTARFLFILREIGFLNRRLSVNDDLLFGASSGDGAIVREATDNDRILGMKKGLRFGESPWYARVNLRQIKRNRSALSFIMMDPSLMSFLRISVVVLRADSLLYLFSHHCERFLWSMRRATSHCYASSIRTTW